MLKASLKNPVLRRRARQFGRLLRHSAVTPRTGRSYKPRLVSNGELGLTFIGHASFFVQIGGQNVVIFPHFSRWVFFLKRLRQPRGQLSELPPIAPVPGTPSPLAHLTPPALRLTFQDPRKAAAGGRGSSLCSRSAFITRLLPKTPPPAPPTLLALSST